MRTRRSTFGSAGAMAIVLLGSMLAPRPVAAAQEPPAQLQEFYTQTLSWSPCEGNLPRKLSCATIAAPLDYAKPTGQKISIALSMARAREPKRRRGVLLINPGGPGETGLLAAHVIAKGPLGDVYDVIGFDPRGVGKSTPANCEQTAPAPKDSRPTDETFPAYSAAARTAEEGCQRASGTIRPFITSTATAKDMDLIRGALRETTINYLGFSYGTYLGAIYGQLFPTRLRRAVFDSSVHPDWIWRRQFQEQAIATRANVDAWATWAGARDLTFGLGTSREAVMATVESVASSLAAKPIDDITRTTFDLALGEGSRYRALWVEISRVVKDLRAGKNPDAPRTNDAVSATRLLAREARLAWRPGVFDTITCEVSWPTRQEDYYADMRVFRQNYPYGAGVSKTAPTNCAFRMYTPADAAPQLTTRTYPEGLVVQAEADPRTRYDGGPAMAARLGHRLVTVKDEGQHALYSGNTCATDVVDAYLLRGELPAPAASCAGESRPAVPDDTIQRRMVSAPFSGTNITKSVREFLREHTNPITAG